jgi:hypothetical protein
MNGVDRLSIRDMGGGAVLAVKVVPGATRDRVAGVLGDCLKITTSAAAEKGKANAAVADILAEALEVDSRSVELIAGRVNPRKEFRIGGVSAEAVRRRLADR